MEGMYNLKIFAKNWGDTRKTNAINTREPGKNECVLSLQRTTTMTTMQAGRQSGS